jgi:hypothetical protein
MKTAELTGAALDWVVQELEFMHRAKSGEVAKQWVIDRHKQGEVFSSASTDWMIGGPIIEREDISFRKYHNPESAAHGKYYAMVCQQSGEIVHWKGWGANTQKGPSALIASMRCYVASKLGDEVEIPKELL